MCAMCTPLNGVLFFNVNDLRRQCFAMLLKHRSGVKSHSGQNFSDLSFATAYQAA